MPSTSKRSAFLARLTGRPSQFPLSARIFHSVCLISILALGYNVPFNYAIGLPYIALASFVMFVGSCGLYYFSRFRHKVTESVFILNAMGLALFTLNFFLNSGHSGPNDLFFLLLLLLSISISPPRQYKVWVPLNMLTVLALHIFEYFYPELVPDSYTGRESQLIDGLSAYVVIALTAFLCMYFIRKSYDRERQSAVEKSGAITKKNQQITIQNQELLRLNSEKNKLMSIVAHDLRAPLSSIQNFLELLTDYDLDFDKRLEIEGNLLDSTRDTLQMLTKLLDWSKSQIYGVVPRPKYLSLQALLAPTIRIEEGIATRKNIRLDYIIDPEAMLFADSEMTQVVFRNLISNAIKFTPAGGTITIRSEAQNVAQSTGDECVISIRDNGIGISKERQQEIFSLNVQSTYGTRQEKGVGLGLLLCMEFVTAQNGKIWFESTHEHGTCFFIALPSHSAEPVAAA
ncbi:sensor histidine kinase [Dyadobacter sandarakinus]|uniref:histidine kinase n=1 Tax=Dyadobacter sandarakinus TaxID=2747268 RepID=A0ABX7I5W5_9BACT|nr:HAMP domain-containing sensor histidine kinase [Dyadobacter sandarakinus]QRR01123.1 HAMP domain-containing histidine kinase [Dyadobacter sandarakinus]